MSDREVIARAIVEHESKELGLARCELAWQAALPVADAILAALRGRRVAA